MGFVGVAMDSSSVPSRFEHQPGVMLWHHSGAWAHHHLLRHIVMCLHSPRVPLCLLGTPSEGQILHVNLMELHGQECLRGCWTVCSRVPVLCT